MTSTAKILIVDDEAALRLTMTEILSRDGHRIITAENGQAALKLIKTQTFDLALVDMNLGDMQGTEILTALRQQSPDTVLIMLTAYASLETAVEALRQGAHDYLFKPCQTVELRESIRRGLLKRRQEIQQKELLRQLEQNMANSLADIQAVIVEQPAASPAMAGSNRLVEPAPAITAQPFEEQGRFLQRGRLIVDFLRHIIILDGHLLELSPTEFGLLAHLISEAPRVVSPQELIKEVQGYDSEQWEASETVRSHIYHIRQKIKTSTGYTKIIRTVRGAGYAISD